MSSSENRIGLDFGDVLRLGPGFLPNHLESPLVPGSLEGVAELTKLFRLPPAVISKCDESTEWKILDYLSNKGFSRYISPQDVYFCRTNEEKRPIAEGLRLTHFVDDTLEVHERFGHVVAHKILFGRQFMRSPTGVIPAADWPDTIRIVRATL